MLGWEVSATLLHLSATLTLVRNPLLILDRDGRIIVAFGGMPEDPEWLWVVRNATNAMKEAREEGFRTGAFSAEDSKHRRGDEYTPLTGGTSFGGGQKRPGNLVLPVLQRPIFSKLIRNQFVRRICGLQSSIFRAFGPKLFADYVKDLRALFDHHPYLRHNFSNSILPCVTFNLGPRSATFGHKDTLNRGLGWCIVTNDGDFDYQKSAHLYLEQLKLVVEFPPAATTCLPSAVLTHGNTPLAPGETRYSITQYAAGGLFRWVKYGFQTAKQLLARKGGRGMKAELDGAAGQRHEAGVNLFSKLSELAADHVATFFN
ncbi:hypothetical protein B0H16DRAFT_1311021 [Mycena metata]|uniref:Uncharacterized protein n=1 Tax=Mycena metata TaxID=1033252 RepID=A0AAD7JFV9_9AGAR|nr:hypothetical protein B0H16DRAFT_1311021 [Mycena metata]